MTAVLDVDVRAWLGQGLVIPAHPLALHADLTFDERHQRALTRYYRASGAGGLAVGVHTTQFSIRRPDVALYEPVLRTSADVLRETAGADPFLMIAGVTGSVQEAVVEAETAARLGYHAVLLAPNDPSAHSEADLIERTRAVAEVLPVIGFYLQAAVGGRLLSGSYWTRIAEIENVVGVKLAPFNRYQTIEAIRGIARAGRGEDIALYTGNDDTIVNDLLNEFPTDDGSSRHFVGGLLGQWAVGAHSAARLLERIKRARDGEPELIPALLQEAAALTDVNGAVFDSANTFRGSIAGVNEVLRRRGLLEGNWCLDAHEVLSPGQAEELDRIMRTYPELTDAAFIEQNRADWFD
jgi:hypothetical protein